MKRVALLGALGLMAALPLAHAQRATASGASGFGLVPSASVWAPGTLGFDHSNAVPGARDTTGHNFVVSMGLAPYLEANLRLASNRLHCNLYVSSCGGGGLNDLSGSFKWAIPTQDLGGLGVQTAIGAIDVGGAASNFTSYYGVLQKDWQWGSVVLGAARKQVATAPLDGPIAAVHLKPATGLTVSLQQVNTQRVAHASYLAEIPGTRLTAHVGVNRRLSDGARLPQQWTEVGVSAPIGGVLAQKSRSDTVSTRYVGAPPDKIRLSQVQSVLEQAGFRRTQVSTDDEGRLAVLVDASQYPRDVLDAAGVALGLLAGVEDANLQRVVLSVFQRDVLLLQVQALPRCLSAWYAGGDMCDGLWVYTAASADRSYARWEGRGAWLSNALPALTLNPVISSTVGTEYGAWDSDLALNMNVTLPLWRGASFDYSRNVQLNAPTEGFRAGGPFNADRIKEGVVRRMIHQVVEVPSVNTVLRLSTGVGFGEYRGWHAESMTTDANGIHRINFTAGSFLGPYQLHPIFKLPLLDVPRDRTYVLARYRYVWDRAHRYTTEVTAGKFFGGDLGGSVVGRVWYGDANYAVYLRKTKMEGAATAVAFAGVQITIPLTPRKSLGGGYAALQGNADFQYSVESKVGAKDNNLTRSYGEVPLFGEHLSKLMNRDRMSQLYLDANLWRLRDAYFELYR